MCVVHMSCCTSSLLTHTHPRSSSPPPQHTPQTNNSDVVFTAAFTLESIMKVVAFGFKPYMSFFQNQVDIAIVVSSLVMIFLESLADLDIVKAGEMIEWDWMWGWGAEGVRGRMIKGTCAVTLSKTRRCHSTQHSLTPCPQTLTNTQTPTHRACVCCEPSSPCVR